MAEAAIKKDHVKEVKKPADKKEAVNTTAGEKRKANRSSFYVVRIAHEFKSKKAAEDWLSENELKPGEKLLRGRGLDFETVEAVKIS